MMYSYALLLLDEIYADMMTVYSAFVVRIAAYVRSSSIMRNAHDV
jgi:hypothetical protein